MLNDGLLEPVMLRNVRVLAALNGLCAYYVGHQCVVMDEKIGSNCKLSHFASLLTDTVSEWLLSISC